MARPSRYCPASLSRVVAKAVNLGAFSGESPKASATVEKLSLITLTHSSSSPSRIGLIILSSILPLSS